MEIFEFAKLQCNGSDFLQNLYIVPSPIRRQNIDFRSGDPADGQ
jgi:hypothetical protein